MRWQPVFITFWRPRAHYSAIPHHAGTKLWIVALVHCTGVAVHLYTPLQVNPSSRRYSNRKTGRPSWRWGVYFNSVTNTRGIYGATHIRLCFSKRLATVIDKVHLTGSLNIDLMHYLTVGAKWLASSRIRKQVAAKIIAEQRDGHLSHIHLNTKNGRHRAAATAAYITQTLYHNLLFRGTWDFQIISWHWWKGRQTVPRGRSLTYEKYWRHSRNLQNLRHTSLGRAGTCFPRK